MERPALCGPFYFARSDGDENAGFQNPSLRNRTRQQSKGASAESTTPKGSNRGRIAPELAGSATRNPARRASNRRLRRNPLGDAKMERPALCGPFYFARSDGDENPGFQNPSLRNRTRQQSRGASAESTTPKGSNRGRIAPELAGSATRNPARRASNRRLRRNPLGDAKMERPALCGPFYFARSDG